MRLLRDPVWQALGVLLALTVALFSFGGWVSSADHPRWGLVLYILGSITAILAFIIVFFLWALPAVLGVLRFLGQLRVVRVQPEEQRSAPEAPMGGPSHDEGEAAFDPHRHLFSKLMQVDVNGLWIEHAPYIEFIVHVRQTSPWSVTLADVQGRARIGGIETDQPAHLANGPRNLNDPNNWWDCRIRQHLPQSMALELRAHPGDLNLWDDDSKVTISLAGLAWTGSVSSTQEEMALPESVVLEKSFTILGPVREQDGDKLLWAIDPVVVSQVWRQQQTGELRQPPAPEEG